jgi:hypothetical protein
VGLEIGRQLMAQNQIHLPGQQQIIHSCHQA